MRAQEEERRRLARDLHDEVNQALTAILLRLEALAQETPAERAPEVRELKRLVNQAMDELLNLARQLRPSALDDHGLVPAVETQLKRFSARTGIEVRLGTAGDPDDAARGRPDRDLPRGPGGADERDAPRRARPSWRWSWRSRTATRSCACATTAAGSTRASPRATASEAQGGGLGLIGMAERARLVGGELDVRSAPGGGTTITLRVPA